MLSLAACGLYHARWSADIHEEWTRNFKAKMPDLGPKVDAICRFVETTGRRGVITSLDRITDAVTGTAGTVVLPAQEMIERNQ